MSGQRIDMTNSEKLDAIKARLKGQFHDPQLLKLGELSDDKDADILRILALPSAPEGTRLAFYTRKDSLPIIGDETIYVSSTKPFEDWIPLFTRDESTE